MKERIEKTTIKKVNLNDEDLEKIVGGRAVFSGICGFKFNDKTFNIARLWRR